MRNLEYVESRFSGRPRDALRSAAAVEAVVRQLADLRYVILKSLAGIRYASAYGGDFASALGNRRVGRDR